MLRLYRKTHPKNLPRVHDTLDSQPADTLYRME